MLSLLNASAVNSATFWLIVALGVILIVELMVFAIIFLFFKAQPEEDGSRQLEKITLDTSAVKCEYKPGEIFDPTGLVVTAHYNLEPLTEEVFDYTIFPFWMRAGRKSRVTVYYRGKRAFYMISVEERIKTVAYQIIVNAPQELNALQVALFNGINQVSSAVNVVDGKARIVAPVGEYFVRVFGLPDFDFEVEAETLSEGKRTATVTITNCEDFDFDEGADEEEPEA